MKVINYINNFQFTQEINGNKYCCVKKESAGFPVYTNPNTSTPAITSANALSMELSEWVSVAHPYKIIYINIRIGSLNLGIYIHLANITVTKASRKYDIIITSIITLSLIVNYPKNY